MSYLNLRRLRLTTFLLLFGCAFIMAQTQERQVSVNLKNASLEEVFSVIEKQTSYRFAYRDVVIEKKKNVTISKKNVAVSTVLDAVLPENGLQYSIVSDKSIVISKKQQNLGESSDRQKKITGVVTDVKGEAIIGANVMEKGTSNGVVTDLNGNFILEVSANAVIHVSYIGYDALDIPVAGKTNFVIQLRQDAKALDEVVVIGYTTQKKGLLTGAVVSMNVSEDLKTIPTTSAGNILAGKMSGVNVNTPKGIPGTAPDISIRTGSSWNAQPITYVIDGVVRGSEDFNNLSPNEIENITVLKDAASAAIYGSRSAGGVILVTTRRGTVGKPVFNYSMSMGIDTRTKNASRTSAVQAGELYNRINGSSDPAGWAWSQEELDHYKTVNNGWGYDQLESVWQNPTTQSHNLSVTGGSEKVRYFAGTSYVKQQGFLTPLTYDKLNFRLNVTVDVTKNLQFFAGMGLTDNKQGNITWEGAESLYRKLLVWQPDQPVFTDSGKPVDYGWIANVGATVNGDGGYNKNNFVKPQMVLNVTYQMPFLEGLSAKAAYSKNWAYTQSSVYQKSYEMNIMKRDGVNRHIIHTDDASIVGTKNSSNISKDYLQKSASWGGDYQLNLQLNYQHTFNSLHNVQGALVYERNESNGASVYGGRETFPVYRTDQFWAASSARADTWGGGDTDWINGRVSYIGQFSYSYANKYLLGFSFREDGSMNFAPGQRWGFFPAASAGWVVSEESFFKNEKINHLKLRASIGLIGNDAVGGWQWQESYKSGNSAYFGTSPAKAVGITYGSVVNPNLTWEKALSYNLGADINFLNHWSASAEYWFKKSYDILGARNAKVPTSFSLSLPSENYGQINAQGFDFSLGYQNKTGDFEYHGNLNLSYGWNKVIKQDYAENANWIDIPVGKSRSVIKGYRFDQILKTQKQLVDFNSEHPGYKIGGLSPELGMMVFKDLSGPEGIPDNKIDSWDRDILSANNFPIVYGLNLGGNWKGFSLDMMFNGNLKYQKSYSDLAGGVEWNRMWDKWYNDSWTAENPNATFPKRISANSSSTYTNTTDFWYKDASFIRLKYVNVAYALPKNLYGSVFDRVKLFFSGTNLLALSSFSEYDPEIGGGFEFPVMRSYSFGVDVTF